MKFIVLLLLLFIQLIFSIEVNFQNIDVKGTCGNKKRHQFEEECDGVEHCTEYCTCETNFYPVPIETNCGEDCPNQCLPTCEIAGCIPGCLFPDDCTLCNVSKGYKEDCTGCIDGYSPRGFLICEKDPEIIYTPEKYFEKYNHRYQLKNGVYNLTKEHVLPTYSHCTTYLDPSAKSFPGVWFEFVTDKEKYVSISTDNDYTWEELNFLTKQEVWIGTDTALILQDDNDICIHKNDDVIDYVSTSRLTFFAEPDRVYRVLIHGYYGSYLDQFKLIVNEIEHPCAKFQQQIEWNDILSPNGYTVRTKSAIGSLSQNSCRNETTNGNWFVLNGADHSLLISGTPMMLNIISVPIDENTCVSENATCEAVISTREDGNVIILQMSRKRKYFFFFSFHEDHLFITFTMKLVCTQCTGFCSLTYGDCYCSGKTCQKCGNGKLDEGEECDNSYIESKGCNNQTCSCDEGFISRNGKCVISTCGNGRIDDGEECDGGKDVKIVYVEKNIILI